MRQTYNIRALLIHECVVVRTWRHHEKREMSTSLAELIDKSLHCPMNAFFEFPSGEVTVYIWKLLKKACRHK